MFLDFVTPFTRMNSGDGVVGSYEAEGPETLPYGA